MGGEATSRVTYPVAPRTPLRGVLLPRFCAAAARTARILWSRNLTYKSRRKAGLGCCIPRARKLEHLNSLPKLAVEEFFAEENTGRYP